MTLAELTIAVLLTAILLTLNQIRRRMPTQAEIAEELRGFKAQVKKILAEIVDAKTKLQETIKSLEDIIATGNTGEATAELITVKDELKAELQILDDLHTDVPPAEPIV